MFFNMYLEILNFDTDANYTIPYTCENTSMTKYLNYTEIANWGKKYDVTYGCPNHPSIKMYDTHKDPITVPSMRFYSWRQPTEYQKEPDEVRKQFKTVLYLYNKDGSYLQTHDEHHTARCLYIMFADFLYESMKERVECFPLYTEHWYSIRIKHSTQRLTLMSTDFWYYNAHEELMDIFF